MKTHVKNKNEEIRVLLIDDDEDDYVITRNLLNNSTRVTFKLSWVDSYDMGINRIRSGDYDIALIDYRLGAHNGLDLIKEAHEKGVNEPMILLTGKGDVDVDFEAMRAGAADYLSKNKLDHEVLERTIRYAVEHARMMTKIVTSSKMSTLGEMAACIAHEINNPLAVIQGQAENLLLMLQDKDFKKTEAKDAAALLTATSVRIAKVVSSLRSFARDSAHDPFERISLRKVVNEALNICSERFRAHEVELVVAGEGLDAEVECRRIDLSQALLNLLSNSFDAVEKLPERWVRIEVKARDGTAEVSVTDSGNGIPEELRTRILRPFFTTKAFDKGTGLGLSIVQRIAESHGGKLRCDFDSPRTRFVLSIPRRQGQLAASA